MCRSSVLFRAHPACLLLTNQSRQFPAGVFLLILYDNIPALFASARCDPAVEIPCMKRFYLASVLLFCTAAVHAEDWPAWRGPRLDGSSLEKNLPLKWSVTKDPQTNEERLENIAWR